MKLTYEFTVRSAKTGKPLKRKRQFDAGSEAEARKLAEEAGVIPVDVELIDVWHTIREVAGVSFKNPDNTSRYKVIRSCKVGDEVILEHESGNQYDENAIRVLNSSGGQMGHLPREVAEAIMKWYVPGQSPTFSAIIDDIRTWDGGGCPQLRLVVAAPSASEDKIAAKLCAEGVQHPSRHLPRRLLESRPKVRFSQQRKSGSGCMVLMAVLVVATIGLWL